MLPRATRPPSPLLRRHGGLVRSVCGQVLRHDQDADDAFQATFLVFAARAGSIRKSASVASWLYGVAYRTARSVKRARARRGEGRPAPEATSREHPVNEAALREIQAILAHEVSELPEKYRSSFVLCCLGGKSKAEAARELGLKEGTVSSRLARARKLLQDRLSDRGVALAAALCAAELGRAATVRPALAECTTRAALSVAAGGSGELVSAEVAALARGVYQGTGSVRLKVVAAVLLAVGCLAGVGALAARPEAPGPAAPPAALPEKKPAPKAAAEGDWTDSGAVEGRVHGPEGKPLAGAEVVVRWDQGEEPAPRGARTTSGPDGRFRLRFARSEAIGRRLAPHTDLYHFAPLQVVASARGYGPGWAHVQPGDRGEGLTLRLTRDAPVKGRVLDVQFRPVTDATVRVLGADGASLAPWPGLEGGVKTDREGRFVLAGVGRDRTLRLCVTGPTIERRTVEVPAGKGDAVEVIARPTRVLVGTVRAEATGKPLAGVVVRGGPQHGMLSQVHAITDEKGRYRLVGLPRGGSYDVTAWPARGQPFLPRTARVGDSQGLRPITVDFSLAAGVHLRVRMVDGRTGKPVRGMVVYDPLGNNRVRPSLIRNDAIAGHSLWQFPVAYPDRDGYCHLTAAPGPGAVFGQGTDTPYLTRPLDPADARAYPFLETTPFLQGGLFHYWELFQSYRVFDAKPGRPLTVDIEMDPGQIVEGSLVGPDSKPVAGVVAIGLAHSPQKTANWSYRNDPLYRLRVESRTLQTDRFAAAGLAPGGTRPVTFLHPGHKLIANAVVRAGKGPLRVRLERWAAVTGRLLGSEGKPAAGVTVGLVYPDPHGPGLLAPGSPFRTDDSGRFRVEGLIPGQKHRLTLPGEAVQEVGPFAAGEVKDIGDVRPTAGGATR